MTPPIETEGREARQAGDQFELTNPSRLASGSPSPLLPQNENRGLTHGNVPVLERTLELMIGLDLGGGKDLVVVSRPLALVRERLLVRLLDRLESGSLGLKSHVDG